MVQNVFIIGATGNVGSELLRQITEKDLSPDNPNQRRIVGVASSTHLIFDILGINPNRALAFSQRNYEGSAAMQGNLEDITSIAHAAATSKFPIAFVDVTAERDPVMTLFHYYVISGKPYHTIVTANKKPLAQSVYAMFRVLTDAVNRYGYRCTVMAGAEGAIPFLQEQRDLGYTPSLVMGCFSGTLGYICTEIQRGTPFSTALQGAIKKGYAEKDPRTDLEGLDVANKLVIVARTAELAANLNDIKREPFVPTQYLDSSQTAQAFLQSAPALDPYFRERMEQAEAHGCTLRYIGSMRGSQLEASLQEVPIDSPLGRLQGRENIIVVASGAYSEEHPHVSIAIGAGPKVTAQNLRADLLNQIQNRRNRSPILAELELAY